MDSENKSPAFNSPEVRRLGEIAAKIRTEWGNLHLDPTRTSDVDKMIRYRLLTNEMSKVVAEFEAAVDKADAV